jgi:hypothetical protein
VDFNHLRVTFVSVLLFPANSAVRLSKSLNSKKGNMLICLLQAFKYSQNIRLPISTIISANRSVCEYIPHRSITSRCDLQHDGLDRDRIGDLFWIRNS